MAWTTPVLAGSASKGTINHWHLTVGSFPALNEDANWTPDWTSTDTSSYFAIRGDDLELRNIDVFIPGGGANVTRMKVEFDYDSVVGDTTSANVSILPTDGTATLTGWFSADNDTGTRTMDLTLATWGLTGSEVDNLVSDSASYGFTIRPWWGWIGYYTAADRFLLQNFYISFEYTAIGGGGILLAK